MTLAHEMALLRLVAQRIAGPPLATVGRTVRWLSALQAQDYPGALTSVALRTADCGRADVEAALDTGDVVRSWPMRGTKHLTAGEDLPWMLGLTASRGVATGRSARAQAGLDDDALVLGDRLTRSALAGGRRLRRPDLLAVWSAAGLDPGGGRGSHLLRYLAQTGTICLGPVEGKEQLVVLVDEWIVRPRMLDREEALGEWAGRYFASHGPATVRDFARWTGLTLTDARTGLDLARFGLERLVVDDVDHCSDPATASRLATCRDAARGVYLVPGFDELVLGYADRSVTVPPQYAELIVPGGNGIFKATVIDDGRAVGTWTRDRTGHVVGTPFETFRPTVIEVLGQM